MGGSAGGDTVARGPAAVPVAAPGNATAVVVGPIGVPEVPAIRKKFLFSNNLPTNSTVCHSKNIAVTFHV